MEITRVNREHRKGYQISTRSRLNKEVEFILKNKIKKTESPKLYRPINKHACIQNMRFPITFNRVVEKGLVKSLRKLEFLDLEKRNLPTKGNARTSDFAFFDKNQWLIHSIEQDLFVGFNYWHKYFYQESWFRYLWRRIRQATIFELSEIKSFGNLQNTSHLYICRWAIKNCNEPGFLKFYDPDELILPTEGMVIIFPAERYHSVCYSVRTG